MTSGRLPEPTGAREWSQPPLEQGGERAFFQSGRKIYMDESAFFADDPNLARAGVAALQMDGDTTTALWSASVPVPYACTAAVGAQFAAVRCTELCDRALLVVDCAAIIANATKHEHARHYRNPASGLWRWVPLQHWPEVIKTPAHRTRKQAEQEGDLENWEGNNRADIAAKQAALRGEPEGIVEQVQAFRTRAKTLIRAALDHPALPRHGATYID